MTLNYTQQVLGHCLRQGRAHLMDIAGYATQQVTDRANDFIMQNGGWVSPREGGVGAKYKRLTTSAASSHKPSAGPNWREEGQGWGKLEGTKGQAHLVEISEMMIAHSYSFIYRLTGDPGSGVRGIVWNYKSITDARIHRVSGPDAM